MNNDVTLHIRVTLIQNKSSIGYSQTPHNPYLLVDRTRYGLWEVTDFERSIWV